MSSKISEARGGGGGGGSSREGKQSTEGTFILCLKFGPESAITTECYFGSLNV